MTLREHNKLYDALDASYNQLAAAKFDIRKLPEYVKDRLFLAYTTDGAQYSPQNMRISDLEVLLSEWLTDGSRQIDRVTAFKLGAIGDVVKSVNRDYFAKLTDMQTSKGRLAGC
jgi:uncharacterized membrane protein YjdF